MIKSEVVKIKKINNFDNINVEQELTEMNINPLRWAIIDMNDEDLFISVSY